MSLNNSFCAKPQKVPLELNRVLQNQSKRQNLYNKRSFQYIY